MPISDQNEIDAIEIALKTAAETRLSGAKIHLTEALRKLTDKKQPDSAIQ